VNVPVQPSIRAVSGTELAFASIENKTGVNQALCLSLAKLRVVGIFCAAGSPSKNYRSSFSFDSLKSMERKILMEKLRVRDVMTTGVTALKRNEKLTVADDIMHLGRIRHLPVTDDDNGSELIGIVSQRDLLRGALGSRTWLR
jgi:CBS domain-containing protein